ncbi:hypothetical protein ACXDJA_002578 [Klebsiella variicola]
MLPVDSCSGLSRRLHSDVADKTRLLQFSDSRANARSSFWQYWTRSRCSAARFALYRCLEFIFSSSVSAWVFHGSLHCGSHRISAYCNPASPDKCAYHQRYFWARTMKPEALSSASPHQGGIIFLKKQPNLHLARCLLAFRIEVSFR